MYERPRNHQGIAYDYFTCTGRRLKRNTCQRSAILVHRVEDHITHAYQQQGVTSDEATRTKSVLGRVFDALAAASADERATLSAQKAKLEAEQVKLLQAHYADAIPIDLLKTEQDRIRASLHAINSRLDSLGTLYANAKIGLDAILDILTDLGDLYAKAEPAERRMLNRALFTKITIDDAEHVTTEPVQTIATILATDTSPNNARTLPHDEAGQGSNVTGYVEVRGFEPLASSMPWKRATNCAIPPDWVPLLSQRTS